MTAGRNQGIASAVNNPIEHLNSQKAARILLGIVATRDGARE